MYLLRNLDYSITDHCNLKCENCGTFSPYKPKKFVNINTFTDDIGRISARFTLKNFKLFGGEPLLHPQLTQILFTSRKNLTDTEIILISNGVNFAKLQPAVFRSLHILDIRLDISRYNIKVDYDQIQKICEQYSIRCSISECKKEFMDFVDTTGSVNPVEIFDICQKSFSCPEYYNGKIYSCGYAKDSAFLNATNKLDKQAVDDGEAISKSDDVLYNYLNTPRPTCRFCTCNTKMKPWRQIAMPCV